MHFRVAQISWDRKLDSLVRHIGASGEVVQLEICFLRELKRKFWHSIGSASMIFLLRSNWVEERVVFQQHLSQYALDNCTATILTINDPICVHNRSKVIGLSHLAGFQITRKARRRKLGINRLGLRMARS